MNDLKSKAVSGMAHSFIGQVASSGLTFIVGIILARLLAPSDYGLLGMVAIFTAISSIFVDSGLTTALIREEIVTDEDYSTVFFYNLGISIIAYVVLFSFAGTVSDFFKEPSLVPIIRWMGLSVIIGAFGNIQRTKLTRELNFRSQTKIDVASAVISSVVGVYLAYISMGVWALVVMGLVRTLVNSSLLMYTNRWTPLFVFNKSSFQRYFNFGYKMLITGILSTAYQYIYNMIIGRTYSADTLGYYTKAKALKDNVSMSVMGTVSKVGYPLLSNLKEDKERLSIGFRKIINHVSYLTFPIFFGMIAISEPLITLLYGEKWIFMIPYFRVLCLSAIVFPHNALNLSVLQVVGRSDLFLKLDSINFLIGIGVISLTVVFNLGIDGLLASIIFLAAVSFAVNAYYSKKYINYSLFEQIKDLVPSLTISVLMSIIVYGVSTILFYSDVINLLIIVLIGILSYIVLSILFNIHEYKSTKDIMKGLYKNIRSKK